jgi:uncharacterized protein (DUF305 family)
MFRFYIIFTLVLILIAILSIIGYSIIKKGATTNPVFNLNENSISVNMADKMMGNVNNPMSINGDTMMMGMMNMPDLVKDDQSFIENMIPHHQEAIDSSNQILGSTIDLELKTFAQSVISAQTKEISEMKTWYKTWFNKDYTPSSNYQAMMGGMKDKTGTELDQAYVRSMIMHHKGAIQMATKIQTITKRPELLKLADDIVTTQTRERAILMNWIMSKYNDRGMMGR